MKRIKLNKKQMVKDDSEATISKVILDLIKSKLPQKLKQSIKQNDVLITMVPGKDKSKKYITFFAGPNQEVEGVGVVERDQDSGKYAVLVNTMLVNACAPPPSFEPPRSTEPPPDASRVLAPSVVNQPPPVTPLKEMLVNKIGNKKNQPTCPKRANKPSQHHHRHAGPPSHELVPLLDSLIAVLTSIRNVLQKRQGHRNSIPEPQKVMIKKVMYKVVDAMAKF